MTVDKPSLDLLDEWMARGWALVDGKGGYAAGNAALLPADLSDGLVVAAAAPPRARFVLLSRLEEVVSVRGKDYPISTQRYLPDVVSPMGYGYLEAFTADPVPTWVYQLDEDLAIQRTIIGVRDEGVFVIQYRLVEGEGPVRLKVRPMLAFRRMDEPTFENPTARLEPQVVESILSFSLYDGLPKLYLSSTMAWTQEPYWYKNFHYPGQVDGLDREDLPTPGFFSGIIGEDEPVVLVAGTTPEPATKWQDLMDAERRREERCLAGFPVQDDGHVDPVIRTWILRAEDYVAGTPAGQVGVFQTIPKATPDSRAGLMGLRGLFLLPGKYEQARAYLSDLADRYSRGLLPTTLDEWGEGPGDLTGYDTLLWLPVAAYSYLTYTDDIEFIRSKLFWTLIEIGGQIQRGLPGLRMDRVDNLLVVGEDGVPHTWMNALDLDGEPVTLRRGKPVELNALWYNACESIRYIADRLGRSNLMRTYAGLARRLRDTFPREFWNLRAGCLYDVVSSDHKDDSVRPNQLFALSLPFHLVEGDRAKSLVAMVTRELLTPYGLRTLSPRSPGYVGVEGSNPHLRHQGSVYPWLLGPYISALAKVEGNEQGFVERVRGLVSRLTEGDPTALPGHLRERYDGDAPHEPRGATSYALNLAELLRAYVEDVLQYPAFNIRPASQR